MGGAARLMQGLRNGEDLMCALTPAPRCAPAPAPARQATLGASGGVLALPLIKNKKTVNPRDGASPTVFQLETAMGSAIECFEGAAAVVVPRTRFAPVKTTSDLFVLRSDVYAITPAATVEAVVPKARAAAQGATACWEAGLARGSAP
jgi:hypothetical protein